MSSIIKLIDRKLLYSSSIRWSNCQTTKFSSQSDNKQEAEVEHGDEEFRVLNLRQTSQPLQRRRQYKKEEVPPPRTHKMHIDQNWGAVWPGPRSFHPATVPLPLRQGFTEKGAASPSKFANAELMKIPNFLHLTPPVIKKQCEALKQFCTAWPEGLETDAKCQKHFPIDLVTSDYCHALPTIRNPKARVVKLKIKLSHLKFDEHARDKFLRLVGNRYDSETDILTIVTDRCPLKKQNYDYAMYLLTACYHESFITEPWESTKLEADMEYFDFNKNKSKATAEGVLNWNRKENEEIVHVNKDFGLAVESLINDGENEENLRKYKEQVLKLVGLQS